MIGNQDLGLSLSLSSRYSSTTTTTNLNLTSSSSRLPHALSTGLATIPVAQWSHVFAANAHSEKRFRGIDVNQVAERDVEEDEEPAASSPNSTLSTVSGKRTERDAGDAGHGVGDELDLERESLRGASDEEDGYGCRKKLRLSKDQSAILEDSFKEHNTLNPKQKMALAKQLNLRARQVEVWFQNRRARTKLKQTEVDCEFLKRCCENLTEENRRLQKEVQELRALKLSPQFYMQMTPPTTLTMCPSCERVSNFTTSSSTTPSLTPTVARAEHHHPYLYHHGRPQNGAPWAPLTLRPAFLGAPPQNF